VSQHQEKCVGSSSNSWYVKYSNLNKKLSNFRKPFHIENVCFPIKILHLWFNLYLLSLSIVELLVKSGKHTFICIWYQSEKLRNFLDYKLRWQFWSSFFEKDDLMYCTVPAKIVEMLNSFALGLAPFRSCFLRVMRCGEKWAEHIVVPGLGVQPSPLPTNFIQICLLSHFGKQ
jgi:hypothetical protein